MTVGHSRWAPPAAIPSVAPRSGAGGSSSTGPILVASDGASPSASAFIVARLLAERLGAEVSVVSALEPSNVVVPPLDPPAAPVRAGATRMEERRARLDLLARSADDEAARWPVEIVYGDRVPSIARLATERGARLVVTGHTHHGVLERFVRHETPLAIARAACVPVLALPAAMTRLPRGVVVAVGLGDAAVRVSAVPGSLFGDAVAVHLVHVREPALPRHDRAMRQEEEADDRSFEHAFDRARERWRLPADVSAVTRVLVGKPADELRKFAQSVGADLLVVGLSIPGDAPHLPHRSLAARLYREWPHALLLVPIGDAE